MRVLGGAEAELAIVDVGLPDAIAVAVPGFGHLVMVRSPDHPNAGRAVLTRGPGTERYLDARWIDGHVEVSMLHKADRLDVVIEP